MPKILNLLDVFKSEAEDLRRARVKAHQVHSTKNIKAAGNEVEEAVRGFLRRMLPARYYVTNGHLIDMDHFVSPHLDVIIADNFNLPSLLTIKDGTEYVPITSVYAIGEVKSTYYHSQIFYPKLQNVLRDIYQMNRPLKVNTCHGGIKASTTIEDMMRGTQYKHLNYLYSFFMCIDGGDFDFQKLKEFFLSTDVRLIPNLSVFLNKGTVSYGKVNKKNGLECQRYPLDVIDEHQDYDWFFSADNAVGHDSTSLEGANLACLYSNLISHLSHSHLGPPNINKYMPITVRRASLIWAKEERGQREL